MSPDHSPFPSPRWFAPFLEAAGWTDVQVTDLQLDPPHPAGGADAVADVVMQSNPLLAEGFQRHPNLRTATHAAISDAVRPFERDGIVHLAAHALIVSGHS